MVSGGGSLAAARTDHDMSARCVSPPWHPPSRVNGLPIRAHPRSRCRMRAAGNASALPEGKGACGFSPHAVRDNRAAQGLGWVPPGLGGSGMRRVRDVRPRIGRSLTRPALPLARRRLHVQQRPLALGGRAHRHVRPGCGCSGGRDGRNRKRKRRCRRASVQPPWHSD